MAALIAIYEALFTDYRKQLAAGEVATVMVIAADRKQARSVMRYTSGLINSNAWVGNRLPSRCRKWGRFLNGSFFP